MSDKPETHADAAGAEPAGTRPANVSARPAARAVKPVSERRAARKDARPGATRKAAARPAGAHGGRGAHTRTQRGAKGDRDAYVRVPKKALVAIAAVAAVVLVAMVAVIAAELATPAQTRQVSSTTTQAWVSPYDWSNVREDENGYLAYYKDGRKVSEAGVDVSEHDGEIDWEAVRASGIDFAMIRLGYRGYSQGTIALDSYFLANLEGATKAGLKVGVYFFSQATSADEAREEAAFVTKTLADAGATLAYPVVFDEEPITNGDVARTDGMASEQFSANAAAFCQAVQQAGYEAAIYGNQHDLAKLDLAGELANYPVWYAEYGVDEPTGQVDFTMWQYTDSGTVDGIPATAGQVDVNIRFLEE